MTRPSTLLASVVTIVVSLVIGLLSLHFAAKAGWNDTDESRVYALSFAGLPVLACLILQGVVWRRQNREETDEELRLNGFLTINGVWMILLLAMFIFSQPDRMNLSTWSVGQMVLNIGFACCLPAIARRQPFLAPVLAFLAEAVTTLLPIAFLLFLLVGMRADLSAAFAEKIPGFSGLTYTGLFCVGLGAFTFFLVSSRFIYGEGGTKRYPRIARILLEILGIVALAWVATVITLTPKPDVQTMNAYIGSTGYVLSGGVPLVDVFCQYGMFNYLVFNALFLFLPPSYMGAAFVVGLVNAIYISTLLLLLRRVLTNKALAYLVAAFAGVSGIALDFNGVLPIGGMRFLPALLVLLAIVRLPVGRLFSLFSLAAVVVASLWSMEALIWSLITYLSFIAGDYLILRRSLLGIARPVLQLIATFLAPHALYSIVILITKGTAPGYHLYLDQIFNLYGGANGGWAYPIDSQVLIWVIAPLVYISVYSCAAWLIVRPPGNSSLDPILFARVCLPTAILGGLELSYWVGRSLIFHFWPTVPPLLVLLAVLIDRLMPASTRPGFRLPAVSCLVALALLCSAAAAWSFNSGGLRIDGPALAEKIAIARAPAGTTDVRDKRIGQAVELVKKWREHSNDVLILMPGSVATATLFYTSKRHLLHITNSHNDPSSILLTRRSMAYAETAVKENELLFLHEDCRLQMYGSSQLPPDPDHVYTRMDLQLMEKLRERWRMTIVERTSLGLLALRLTSRENPLPPDSIEYSLEPPPKP